MVPICNYGEANYWLSIGILNKKSKIKPIDIILSLEKENIEARHIWKPMNLQPYYKKYNFFTVNELSEISIAEDIFNRGICLPSDTKITDRELEIVIRNIKKLFR